MSDSTTVINLPPVVSTTVSTPAVGLTSIVIPAESSTVITTPGETATVLTTPQEIKTVLVTGQGPSGPPGAQGPIGLPGGSVTSRVAGVNLNGHRAVFINNAGLLEYASCSFFNQALRVLGITTGAANTGDFATVASFGELIEPSWNWNPNDPIYLGLDGFLTQVTPDIASSSFSLVLGFPITNSSMHIHIGNPVKLV